MPAYTTIGPWLTTIEQVEKTIRITRSGIAQATMSFHCAFTDAVACVAGLARHPDYDFLTFKDADITRMEMDSAEVKINFEGVPPFNSEGKVTWSLEGCVADAPIDTHPHFNSILGGVKGAELNFAVFDENDNTFKHFAGKPPDGTAERKAWDGEYTGGGANLIKAGVKSYEMPTAVLTKVTVGSTDGGIVANLSALGTINTPSLFGNISLNEGDKRTWLYWSVQFDQIGTAGLKTTEKWKLSGPRGWDFEIYGDQPDA